MAIKKIFFIIIFLNALFSLFTQTSSDQIDTQSIASVPEYYIETRFVQRLSWRGDGYASRYEVIIERETGGVYRNVIQEITTEFFIEVRLQSGKYRYQVFPYDYFNQRGTGSGWIEFEIFPAYFPVLHYAESDLNFTEYETYIVIHNLTILLYGNNIESTAQIFLRFSDGRRIYPDNIEIINRESNTFRLVINRPESFPDIFEVVVINPGGLEASLFANVEFPRRPARFREILQITETEPEDDETEPKAKIEVREPQVRKKYFDNYFGIAFMPQLPLYGDIFHAGEDNISLSGIYLPGITLRYAFMLSAPKIFSFGFDMVISFYGMSEDYQFTTVDISLLLQRKLSGFNSSFIFRGGIGSTTAFGGFTPHINTGVSFLWLPLGWLYIETGVDFIFWNQNINQSEFASCYRPFLGMGLKF